MKDTVPSSPLGTSAVPTASGSTQTGNESQQTLISGVTPAQVTTSSALPAAFGRYSVRRELGAGSFGTVYLGHDAQLDRPVAIKVLRLGSGVPQAESDRLLSEARRLARLHHPGIVAVFDVGTEDGQMYIVSNYLDGQDLATWLAHTRPSWQESAAIVASICDALAHAHSHLTIHRDVKPANIILTSNRTPVLVDFGLALDELSAGGRELGLVSGTPAYMAPEQIAGTAHRIDGRTDIYSLGVVLYEMLCHHLPFRGNEVRELLRQVRDDEPQPPRQLESDIPVELERICLKALAKKIQDRYVTAADFAADLRGVIQHASVSSVSTLSPLTSSSRQLTQQPLRPPSTQQRMRDAERRQVTVLVCGSDIFEDDSYLGLDAEEQAKLLNAFRDYCEDVVRRFDGTVVQCNDQGLLACFGYPIAQEDAAPRAAHAALSLFSGMPALADQFQREHQLQWRAWCAIHTGAAVVETHAEQISLVGEARNVALRLESVADSGQVVCTEDTQRLIQARFQCLSLGQRTIKGIPRPVQIYRIEGENKSRSAFESAASVGLSPLAGRDLEVSLLKDRWEQAQEGMGQVVLLAGEPGLGKSRLVYTLKEHVLGQFVEGEVDAPVVEWRCSPQYQNSGLFPAIDFFERALGIDREQPPEMRFERLLDRLEQYDLAHPDSVPLWASLLSLPVPDRFSPLSLSPIRQRDETFRAMLDWLHTRAARRPLMFVVEDLHWVDASTLEFLGKVLSECQHDRILILMTCRPEFNSPWPTAAHITSLSLNRLTRRQAEELMRMRTQGALSEELIDQVYSRAGGVPLFIEEFTKMIQEAVAPKGAGTGESAGGLLPSREIPITLQDLLSARLDRMEGAHDVAQFAATLGREFSYELLAAAAAVDEAKLQSDLEQLVRAEIVFQKGQPPRCTYLFKHALLEDALYNSMVKEKRQEFHRRIAETLEARFAKTIESRPELAAHHFTEARVTDKAVRYWLQAGILSKQKSADVEAIGHLSKGLALLRSLEESPQRDAQELQFVTALGTANIAVRGYAAPDVGTYLQRARELCEQLGDSEQLFGIMLGMWEWRLVRGDLRASVDLAADGMQLAERLNDPGLRMEALFMQGATDFYRGRFESSRLSHVDALTNFDDRDRTKYWTAYSGHDAGVTQRGYLSLDLWHLGYADQAAQMDREASDLARTIGHAFTLGHAVDFTAFLGLCCRRADVVQSAAEEELKIATEHGFQLWQALGTLHKGTGLYLQGRYLDALPLIVGGFSAFRAGGAEVRIPAYLGILGDLYIHLGRLDDAHGAFEEGLAIAAKNDDRCHEAELQRLQGELVLAGLPDQLDDAESWFFRAIETARAQKSLAWELRATMSLARCRKRQGRNESAREILHQVHGAFSEGFTIPDLVDAQKLLAELDC